MRLDSLTCASIGASSAPGVRTMYPVSNRTDLSVMATPFVWKLIDERCHPSGMDGCADPLAWTSSLPPTGGRGVGMAPSLRGRGGGWVGFSAAVALRRLPGRPLEDPPTSPPREIDGACG